MCGRYALWPQSAARARGGLAIEVSDFRYSISPGESAPIARERIGADGDTLIVSSATWGFRPDWLRELRPSMTAPRNARLQNTVTSGMWRESMIRDRCIVPMSGFFDWLQSRPKVDDDDWEQRAPHFTSTGEQLSVAGVAAGATFAIVVRSGTCGDGHSHRSMPVVLSAHALQAWLTAEDLHDARSRREVVDFVESECLRNGSELRCHKVDAERVNVPIDTTDPRLVEPA